MIKLLKYQNGTIKISYNEKVLPKGHCCFVCGQQVNMKTYPVSASFSWGIELAFHTGGRICYGKLMAQVQPEKEKEFVHVEAEYITENTVKYNCAVLWDNTYTYHGLPKEYLDELLESVCLEICKKEKYPQVRIRFAHAANCEVGSSPRLFGIIGKMLIHMMDADSYRDIFTMDIRIFTERYVKRFGLPLAYREADKNEI